jgi:hypothetical protein
VAHPREASSSITSLLSVADHAAQPASSGITATSVRSLFRFEQHLAKETASVATNHVSDFGEIKSQPNGWAKDVPWR